MQAEQRDIIMVVHISEHGECYEPQEMQIGSRGELEYDLEYDERVDEPKTTHSFVHTDGHVPEEKQGVGGQGVAFGEETFDGFNQIIEDTDEQQGDNKIIPQLFPEQFGIGLFLAEEAGDNEEQRHTEHIDITVVEGEEMAIGDQDDSDGFHPIQPVLSGKGFRGEIIGCCWVHRNTLTLMTV